MDILDLNADAKADEVISKYSLSFIIITYYVWLPYLLGVIHANHAADKKWSK